MISSLTDTFLISLYLEQSDVVGLKRTVVLWYGCDGVNSQSLFVGIGADGVHLTDDNF